jgi:hypothetical protein
VAVYANGAGMGEAGGVCVCAYVGMFYATSGPSAANNLCSSEKSLGSALPMTSTRRASFAGMLWNAFRLQHSAVHHRVGTERCSTVQPCACIPNKVHTRRAQSSRWNSLQILQCIACSAISVSKSLHKQILGTSSPLGRCQGPHE